MAISVVVVVVVAVVFDIVVFLSINAAENNTYIYKRLDAVCRVYLHIHV